MLGVALAAAGVVRLGRYTRFVSYSVMIGFLTGSSVNIVCGQTAGLTGAPAQGDFPLAKAVSVLTHPGRINLASLLAGMGALAILALPARTRLAVLSSLVALVIPTVVVAAAGADSVARVGDQGGIPLPQLPDFRLFSFSLVTGALAVAAIVLVRGSAWPRPRRTLATPGRIRTRTSSPRGPATWPQGCSAASPWAARSARPRSACQWAPGPCPGQPGRGRPRLRRRTSLGATFVKVVGGLRRPPGGCRRPPVPERPRPEPDRPAPPDRAPQWAGARVRGHPGRR